MSYTSIRPDMISKRGEMVKLHWSQEHINYSEPYEMPMPHFHNEYEMYYLCQGTREIFIQGEVYAIETGDLLFINKQTVHRNTGGSHAHERFVVNVHPSFVHHWEDLLPGVDFGPLFDVSCVIVSLTQDDKAAVETAMRVIKYTRATDPTQRAEAEIKILDLLFLLLRNADACTTQQKSAPLSKGKYRRVNEICDFILANNCRVTLDELCAHFFLSRYYLCRLFKQGSGMTISEFIASNRVLMAEHLLENTDRRITEVAGEVGFGSISQFEKTFRTYTGVTPRQFRQAYRREERNQA